MVVRAKVFLRYSLLIILRDNKTGLGAPNIDDYFVLTSVHDPPMRAIQLEAYIFALHRLLMESLPLIKDENTKNFIKKTISTVQKSKTNLGDAFFSEAKKRLGLPLTLIWPKDFPSIKFLNATKTTVKLFTPREVGFFLDKKREAENAIAALCSLHNPVMLTAFSTVQMQLSITSTNPEFAEFFNDVWTGEKNNQAVLEKMVQKMLTVGYRKFEVDSINETYRQMVLSGVDLQRALRGRLYKYCSRGRGENTLISEDVFLKLFENLYTIYCIDWIKNMMTELSVPIFVLENEWASVFFPLMSAMEPLPFQKGLSDRENRLFFQYVSSKATDEERIPQWQFFIQTLNEFELKELHFLVWYLTETPNMFVIFPESEANRVLNEKQEFPKEVPLEWINGPKSPFVKVRFKDENYYVATRMIIEDRFFRIMWEAHRDKHIRIRGTKFEDFVLDVLQKQFPDALTYKNKYFFVEVNDEKKRYEIDRTFVFNDLFFAVECKNLLLIEDTANFRKLRSRNQELKAYGNYLELKANLLKNNFEQLEESIPGLKQHNCVRIVPVILSLYPDILTFHKVPFLSVYEFIRYVSACEQQGRFLNSYTDFSKIVFNFPSFEIRREKP